MSAPRIDDRDWSALTSGERIRQIEVEGYLTDPRSIDARASGPAQGDNRQPGNHPGGLQHPPAGTE